MWQFDESAAQFPSPRSEEPANLRREIVEELTDHLTCARRREQMASGEQTEEAVRRRVLDRFGDPAAVARKLWLDWMWERIMTQRILVATCALLAVISCVALGLAWASLKGQKDMMATWQSTSETQLRDQQKHFERLLAESRKSGALSDWNPVEFRFVKGKEDGPPAEGIKLSFSISDRETGIPDMDGVSNKEGVVRFERVRYGRYTASVRNAASELLELAITLQPGQGLTRTIVTPDTPTEPAQVAPRIEWPKDLADKPLWFRFEHSNVYRPVAGKSWQPPVRTESVSRGGHQPLIAPNGDIAQAHWRLFESQSARLGGRVKAPAEPLWNRRHTFESSRLGSSSRRGDAGLVKTSVIDWPGIDYRTPKVEILASYDGFKSLDELSEVEEAPAGRSARGRAGRATRRYFDMIAFASLEWPHRIEPGMGDKAGILWLTPPAAAIEQVRASLNEIDQFKQETQKVAEKERADYAKARAEREQQKQRETSAAPDAEKKGGADSK